MCTAVLLVIEFAEFAVGWRFFMFWKKYSVDHDTPANMTKFAAYWISPHRLCSTNARRVFSTGCLLPVLSGNCAAPLTCCT